MVCVCVCVLCVDLISPPNNLQLIYDHILALKSLNFPPTSPTIGPVQGPHHYSEGQPRIPPDHAGLRVLRRMPPQVRQRLGVELLHRALRLLAHDSAGRGQGKGESVRGGVYGCGRGEGG